MSNDQHKEYEKLIQCYLKYLAQWQKVYGNIAAAGADGPGGGTNPPPPPPPPPNP